MIENPMISSGERELNRREERDKRASLAFETLVADMLTAIDDGPGRCVSYWGAEREIEAVVSDLFESPANAVSFCHALASNRAVRMWLAERYAEEQVEFMNGDGAFDV